MLVVLKGVCAVKAWTHSVAPRGQCGVIGIGNGF